MATRPYLLALLAALPLAAGPARAQQTFSNTHSLAFGRFVAGSGGSITVTPDGARSTSGGVLPVASFPAAASFTWTDTTPGNANLACIIGLPDDGTVTLSSGGDSMRVDGFTSNPSGTAVMSGSTLQFTVGATLTVGPNQPAGSYSGTFQVTIQYQ